jgi:hypothetical protein
MELLGISLILVLIIALSLFYVNYTAQYENVPEGYRNPAAAKCEVQFITCINDGGSRENCTSEYNKCMKDNVTSNNSTSDNLPESGSDLTVKNKCLSEKAYCYDLAGQDSGKQTICDTTYDSCLTKNTPSSEPSAEYTALAAKALKGQRTSTAFETYMKEIQSKFGTEYPKPSLLSLSLAQGGDLNPTGEDTSDVYTKNQTIIKPHEDIPKEKSSLTPQQQNAPDIPLTQASLRQQIRDDIRKAVKEEIDTIDNEYEIKYVTE